MNRGDATCHQAPSLAHDYVTNGLISELWGAAGGFADSTRWRDEGRCLSVSNQPGEIPKGPTTSCGLQKRRAQALVIGEEVWPVQPGASKCWHPIELVKGISPDFPEDLPVAPSGLGGLVCQVAHSRDCAETLQTPADCLDATA